MYIWALQTFEALHPEAILDQSLIITTQGIINLAASLTLQGLKCQL